MLDKIIKHPISSIQDPASIIQYPESRIVVRAFSLETLNA